MSLRLYLDDCAYSRRLCRLLRESGHDVQTPMEVTPSLSGVDDVTHFLHACSTGRVLLTLNAKDFKALHDQLSVHPGILAIHQDNDPTKDMRYADIVQAIANFEQRALPLKHNFRMLNAFKW